MNLVLSYANFHKCRADCLELVAACAYELRYTGFRMTDTRSGQETAAFIIGSMGTDKRVAWEIRTKVLASANITKSQTEEVTKHSK